jgi:ABC-2 type transport system permease protein
VESFAVRGLLRPLAGWAAGGAASFLLVGLIATALTGFLAGNPQFAQAAGQAGFVGLASVQGYAATLFAVLAVPLGVFAATRIDACHRIDAVHGHAAGRTAAKPIPAGHRGGRRRKPRVWRWPPPPGSPPG